MRIKRVNGNARVDTSITTTVHGTCPSWYTGTIPAYTFTISVTDTSNYLIISGPTYSKAESTGAAVGSVCLITYSLEYATNNATSPFTYAAYTGTNVTIDSATGDLKVNRL